MHDVLVNILIVIAAIAATFITRYLVPYIKSITSESRYAELLDVVEIAVKAAEQTMNKPKQGKAKKADVVAFVSHWLAERNLHLSEDELNRIIEATVYAMNAEV